MTPSETTTAYFDCFSGAGGDMLLGAVIAAGAKAERIEEELAKLALPGLSISVEQKTVQSISGIKVAIGSTSDQQLRTLPAIVALLEQSDFTREVRDQAVQVFTALAHAEAKVHAIPVDRVHFHEIGALDTIVDVVGTIFGLQLLGVRRLVASPLPLGRGFVRCDHGLLPLPAPAVCELLQGVPTYGVELSQELITPTAAALLVTLADSFGPMPPMRIGATGYGVGSHRLDNGQPNLVRLIIGEGLDSGEAQLVEVIETNLDDWSPEGFPYLCERLFAKGAVDVTLSPVQMKKGRPGFTLQVISPTAAAHPLKELILTETTAIGLRFRQEERRTLPREAVTVDTRWGEVIAKKVLTPTGWTVHPEYEACRQLAGRLGLPLQAVYNEVRNKGNQEPCRRS